MSRHAWLVVAALCLVAWPGAAGAAETDAVVLLNGNRLVGEIKGLRQGTLEFKTDTMGTVYIKWGRVGELTSPGQFEVEVSSGDKFFGALDTAAPGNLAVASGGRVTPLAMQSVVKIRPLSQSFWERLDGSISFGASYTRSSGVGQGTLNANVTSTREKYEWSVSLSQTLTVKQDEPSSSRTASALTYKWLFPRRWFLSFSGKFDRSPDLGFNGRSSGGIGIGRNVIQTNRSALSAEGGLLVNRETPVTGDSTSNEELAVGATYSYFTYERPKTNVMVSCYVYPSLTVSHRVRADANASVSREIFRDFTVGMTAYDSYDNRPPSGGASKNDLGVSLNVGWSF
jgi:Protein of unknown function, DUF481